MISRTRRYVILAVSMFILAFFTGVDAVMAQSFPLGKSIVIVVSPDAPRSVLYGLSRRNGQFLTALTRFVGLALV